MGDDVGHATHDVLSEVETGLQRQRLLVDNLPVLLPLLRGDAYGN